MALLGARAAVDQPDSDGCTPLYVASQIGTTEMIVVLLNAGAAVNQPDNDGCTPLYAAAWTGQV